MKIITLYYSVSWYDLPARLHKQSYVKCLCTQTMTTTTTITPPPPWIPHLIWSELPNILSAVVYQMFFIHRFWISAYLQILRTQYKKCEISLKPACYMKHCFFWLIRPTWSEVWWSDSMDKQDWSRRRDRYVLTRVQINRLTGVP